MLTCSEMFFGLLFIQVFIVYVRVVQLRAQGIFAARETILDNSSLVDHKWRQPFITRHDKLMGQSLGLRPIPSESFFREHYDFGTKIGKSETIPSEDLFF